MDYQALKNELLNDPLALGLSALSSIDAAAKLNEIPATAIVGLRVERSVVPTWEVFEAVVPSEWTALSAAEKQRLQSLLAMGSVNVKKPNTRAALSAMFGAATTTRTNLVALQHEAASRATVLFGEAVQSWDVERARAL